MPVRIQTLRDLGYILPMRIQTLRDLGYILPVRIQTLRDLGYILPGRIQTESFKIYFAQGGFKRRNSGCILAGRIQIQIEIQDVFFQGGIKHRD